MKTAAYIVLILACLSLLCAWQGWEMGPFRNLLPLGLFLWCLSAVLDRSPWRGSATP